MESKRSTGRQRTRVHPVERLRPGMSLYGKARVILNLSEIQMADITRLTISEIRQLCKPGAGVSEDHGANELLCKFVHDRLGFTMALKRELVDKMDKAIRERLAARERYSGE